MRKSNELSKTIDQINHEEAQKDKFLTFFLGKQEYGIEIKYIVQIIGIQEITAIPNIPHYVRGIINLRGNIIPVMDIRARFKMEEITCGDRSSIIVANVNQLNIGIIVDRVSEVLMMKEEDIADPPEIKGIDGNRYIKKIGKFRDSIKLIIDSELLLKGKDHEMLIESLQINRAT